MRREQAEAIAAGLGLLTLVAIVATVIIATIAALT